ncbi:hypothetical protein PMAYCL1PPCAC_33266 [Pristionchus mayeri]|uniref:C-type lectin n=1 Tax=Pristionchus mayeri TaxID=1317129 RepID=A0AAN5DHD9_9BILA|nr:hypothetical protein PMAYCL1PPCAC_33266 [Pristionchus mayeri]
MRLLLLIYSILEITVHWSLVTGDCPVGFEVVHGECRGLYEKVFSSKADTLNVAIEKCREIDQHPIIIRNINDQLYWLTNRWNKAGFVIGLTCNASSKEWEWIDGSALTFKPEQYDKALDESCMPGSSWYLWYPNWIFFGSDVTDGWYSYIFCEKELSISPNPENTEVCSGYTPGYDIINGECRGFYAWMHVRRPDALDVAIAKCGETQQRPIIIRNIYVSLPFFNFPFTF